jgi:hypothetical protein
VLVDVLHLNEDPAMHVRRRYAAILELYNRNPSDSAIKGCATQRSAIPMICPIWKVRVLNGMG